MKQKFGGAGVVLFLALKCRVIKMVSAQRIGETGLNSSAFIVASLEEGKKLLLPETAFQSELSRGENIKR